MTDPFARPTPQAYPMTALIYGPTGAGKTHGALTLARGLAGPSGKIAVINTEPKGTNWQIGKHDFFEVALDWEKGFDPQKLIDLVRSAADHGYDVVIVDCLTDFWEGYGGLQDIKARLDKQSRNSFANWKAITDLCSEINRTVVRQCGIHVIYTAFARERFKQDPVTKEVIDMGMAPRVRQHLQEKLDLLILLDEGHNAEFTKNRIGAPEWSGPITVEKAAALAQWFAGPQAQERKSDLLKSDTITVTISGGKADEKAQAWIGLGANEVVIFPGLAGPPADLPCQLDIQAKPLNKTTRQRGRDLPMFEAVNYQPHADEADEESEENA